MKTRGGTSSQFLVAAARIVFSGVIFCLLSALVAHAGRKPSAPPQTDSLASLATDTAPWLHIEAGSEQRPPVYLGARPREMELGLTPADGGLALLPVSLRILGERQLLNIWQSLYSEKAIAPGQSVTVEAWPTRDDRSRLTWAFARWTASPMEEPRWLSPGMALNTDPGAFLPRPYDPVDPGDHFAIFADFLQMGIYDKPVFGDCIWVAKSGDPATARPLEAWLPTSLRESYAARGDIGERLALALPQPAHLNGEPVTFRLVVRGNSVVWPASIVWVPDPAVPAPDDRDVVVAGWPADFLQKYRADLLAIDGETEAVFPISGKVVRFERKNNVQIPNQLDDIVEYLEERYTSLGISTWRETFSWRGAVQTNLFAVIPGTDRGAAPVLLADHVDTAFAEDLYHKTGLRISVPGADDNGSATAALLRAAEMLRDLKPRNPIWLVHLTGEEFPSDCLGARAFVSRLLGDRQDIAGLVLLDMIGYADGLDDSLFQLSPGDSDASMRLASVALDAAADVSPELRPLLEPRYSGRSYLYNTDGVIFADTGYPVLLINEHLNYFSTLMREAYHDSTDTSAIINFPYAVGITKVAIETVARLSGAGRRP